MSSVLVVDDSPTQALEAQLMLEDGGYEVEISGNGVEALEVIERTGPDVVLTDLDMPEMNGLELVETIRRRCPHIPVVLMTAKGSEEIAAEALRKGAASYIPKRVLEAMLLPTIRDVLNLAREASDLQQAVQSFLTKTESHFTIGNQIEDVPALIAYIEEELGRLEFCDQTGRLRVRMALSEALTNAIGHGNLELDSKLRQRLDQSYSRLAEERRSVSPYKDRRVSVASQVNQQQAVFVIEDEGSGFDVSAIPDPRDPENIERVSGRGLLLIQSFMDRVEFNEKGNRITITKFRETSADQYDRSAAQGP